MEYDRFEHHEKLYIFGMISLILGLVGIAGTVYFLPYIFFDWSYAIPVEFLSLAQTLQNDYGFTKGTSELTIVGVVFFLGLLFLLIAEMISNHIEQAELRSRKIIIRNIPKESEEESIVNAEKNDTWRIVLVVVMVLFLAVVGVKILEWSVTSIPPNTFH